MAISNFPEAPTRTTLPRAVLPWDVVGFAIAAGECLALTLGSLSILYAYDRLVFGIDELRQAVLLLSIMAAASYVGTSAVRGSYRFNAFLPDRRPLERVVAHWCISFLILLAALFLSKSSAEHSRGAVTFVFLAGIGIVVVLRAAGISAAMRLTKAAAVSTRRSMLVGHKDNVERFRSNERPSIVGIEITGVFVLAEGPEQKLKRDLEAAIEAARTSQPDEIILALPWADIDRIKTCAFRFMELPVVIQLAPEALFRTFRRVNTTRIGALTTLSLVDQPLSRWDRSIKRLMDIGLSSLGLIAALPVFLLVALAIKIESRGPVFFLQRRYGFNRKDFWVFKFRSMYVTERDHEFRQAMPGDARITRVGRFLRRSNLDELPQLLNVLLGTMSSSGPRPHPVALDESYFGRIALYARRHNMKPGITGWAQVNGFRGETTAEIQMRARLVYDIYYLDNWSIGFDIYILFLTLFSRKSFRNAY